MGTQPLRNSYPYSVGPTTSRIGPLVAHRALIGRCRRDSLLAQAPAKRCEAISGSRTQKGKSMERLEFIKNTLTALPTAPLRGQLIPANKSIMRSHQERSQDSSLNRRKVYLQ